MATPFLHLFIFSLLLSATCSAAPNLSTTNLTAYTPSNKTLSVLLTPTPPSSAAASGGSSSNTSTSGCEALLLKHRNTHVILNVISWGVLFPIGGIILRFQDMFKSAKSTWVCLDLTFQLSGYCMGAAGFASGAPVADYSKGIVFEGHLCFVIVFMCLATSKFMATCLRPEKDHNCKYWFYWNICNNCIGYATVIMAISEVIKGLHMVQVEKKWRVVYISLVFVLGGVTVLLDAVSCFAFLKRKWSGYAKTSAKVICTSTTTPVGQVQ